MHLETVFKRLNLYGVTINLAKCDFGKPEVDFLGYRVSKDGILSLSERVKAITDYPKPKTVSELRRFMGMINFYRSHLPNAASYHAILNEYLHNTKRNDKTLIVWSKEAEDAFQLCKNNLQKAVLLSHPVSGAPLAIMSDASNTCAGAVLQQKIGHTWKPLSYFS
ncbi:unnamed protein product [Colias eurytheme]|nr:unnamed protein product [Colias eurytheme]